MLTVVHDADEANDNEASRRSLLDEIVRDGARQMLAAALRAEVAAYIDTHAGDVDENGHRVNGTFTIQQPLGTGLLLSFGNR